MFYIQVFPAFLTLELLSTVTVIAAIFIHTRAIVRAGRQLALVYVNLAPLAVELFRAVALKVGLASDVGALPAISTGLDKTRIVFFAVLF